MNPSLPKGLQISTPTDTTVVMTRAFNASRQLVWEAMFTPSRMRRWMIPPPGCTLAIIECEPRNGGTLKIAWKSEEADPCMTLRGQFSNVVPYERITHTETIALPSGQVISDLVETHEFTEHGPATVMRITQAYKSKAARDEAMASALEGMEACYAVLDPMLAEASVASSGANA